MREAGFDHGEAEEHPKAPAQVANLGDQSKRNAAQAGTTGTNSDGARDAQAARNQSRTGNGKDTPKRPEPTGETLRARTREPQGPNAKRPGTHGRSDRSKDAAAEHKRSPKTRANRTKTRRDTRHKEGTRHDRTEDVDTRYTQAKRPPTHRRPPQAPQQSGSPVTRTDHATRTRNSAKPRITKTSDEKASDNATDRPNGHEKIGTAERTQKQGQNRW